MALFTITPCRFEWTTSEADVITVGDLQNMQLSQNASDHRCWYVMMGWITISGNLSTISILSHIANDFRQKNTLSLDYTFSTTRNQILPLFAWGLQLDGEISIEWGKLPYSLALQSVLVLVYRILWSRALFADCWRWHTHSHSGHLLSPLSSIQITPQDSTTDIIP